MNLEIVHSAERQYGARFWDNPSAWLASEPSFNAHRATAPLLLAPNTFGALQQDAPLHGALRLNGKPSEILYFPFGEHGLIRPRERFVSMQASVDWMNFWLKNKKRTRPVPEAGESAASLKEQYSRWDAFEVQRDRE